MNGLSNFSQTFAILATALVAIAAAGFIAPEADVKKEAANTLIKIGLIAAGAAFAAFQGRSGNERTRVTDGREAPERTDSVR